MTKGRIEMQSQKTFKVKKEKLEFLMRYEVEAIKDFQADCKMCDSDNDLKRDDIKKNIKIHQKKKRQLERRMGSN